MCGIVGYYHLSPERQTAVDVRRMNACITHRGPDEDGYFEGERVGLGMRRLSIIDLSTGQQPIHNETGDVHVIFNGEIYNYRELRAELIAAGHQFTTQSDTEVLVHGYEAWGENLPARLRGMFAFALWDERRQRLMLSRDHFGIKPLYYTLVDGTLLFASEMKALLIHPGVSKALDYTALDQYLAVQYIPEPRTIFSAIRALPPAYTLMCEGGLHFRPYWTFTPLQNPYPDRETAKRAIQEVVEDSVQAMLVADVPLGAFLSGGLDSASVVAMMSRHSEGQKVRTFSVGFGAAEHRWDELETARHIADFYGTEHHEFHVQPDITELMPALVAGFDQPFGNPTALLLYLLSRETRQHVTVALTGTGGDEMFGGYVRYHGMLLYERYARLPHPLRQGAATLANGLIREASDGRMRAQRVRRFLRGGVAPFDEAYLSIISYLDAERRDALYTPDFHHQMDVQARWEFIQPHLNLRSLPPVERIMGAELASYLPYNQLAYNDRMSMAQSLELRVPLVDQRVIEVAGNIPLSWKIEGGVTKSLFREAMRPMLPPDILNLPKKGWVMPLPLWLRGELRGWAESLLEKVKRRGYFQPEALQTVWQEHLSGKRDNAQLIWSLLVLESWQAHFLD